MTNCERLNAAVKLAVEAHGQQCRKGTDRPYILHPMEVTVLLNSMQAETDLLIAGILHDTVEDTAVTLDQIERLFGSRVAILVHAHSENKQNSWKKRKTCAIQELKLAEPDLTLLILADKLSNLRSMKRDYRQTGDHLWQRFNAPKEQQKWYYGQILSVLQDKNLQGQALLYLQEMIDIFTFLFQDTAE